MIVNIAFILNKTAQKRIYLFMLKEERQQYILNKLSEADRVTSLELSKELNVSDDTIRRDLKILADEGLILKVHGGAIPKPSAPISYLERLNYEEHKKIALAKHLTPFIKSDMVLLIDGGTTNLIAVKQFPRNISLTVVTNSIPVAAELSSYANVEIIMLGGNILKSSQVTVGIEAIESLDGIYADLCLMGTCSLHSDLGLTSTNKDESMLKKRMIDSSKKVLLMATNDKLETASNFKVCETEAINYLIPEESADSLILAKLEKKGIEIINNS